MIIALINQKGGCGKSTTAVHLVYWLSVTQQRSVLLVDADAQRSSSQWLASGESVTPYQVLSTPDDLLEQLPTLAEKYDDVIVDGPASLAETTRAILFTADLALIPVQPTGVDLRSAGDAMRLVKQAQAVRKGLPKAAVFVSRAVKGTKLKDEAIALLDTTDAHRLNGVIQQKQAIADTSGQGATVWEIGGRSATESGREYTQLFEEVMSYA